MKKSLMGVEWSIYILGILLLAIVVTLQVYPFVGLADGFQRWGLAIEICQYGRIISETLLSPIIPYIQAITYSITNSYGFYTLIQCFLFYLSIGALIKYGLGNLEIRIWKTRCPAWLITSFILCCFPTIKYFPALLTDSAPIFIILVGLIQVASNIDTEKKWIYLVGIVLIFLCVSIRVNSLVLFVIYGLFFIIKYLICRKRKYMYISISIIIGCMLGIQIPRMLTPTTYNASTLGMTWEMTGIVADTNNKWLKEELSKYGDVDEAVARYGEPYLNSIVWDNNPPFPATTLAGEYSNEITRLYIKTFIKYPHQFVLNKIGFIKGTLGLGEHLISSARGIDGVERTIDFGAMNTAMQFNVRSQFVRFTDAIGFISLRPFNMILMSAILIFILSKFEKVKQYWMMLGMAAAYYSSFIINNQAYEYRYYAPSFYIMLGIVICVGMKLFFYIKGYINAGDRNS